MVHRQPTKKERKKISEKDRKEILTLLKKGRPTMTIRSMFGKYNAFQIGALKQHYTKGDYKRKAV